MDFEFEDDETGDSQSEDMNKKFVFFIVDGSASMLDGGKSCAFLKAMRLVYAEIVQMALSSSLNNQMALIITNTANSTVDKKTQEKLENCVELLEMGNISIAAAIKIKEFVDMGDAGKIEEAFKKLCGGHAACDLSAPIIHAITVFMSKTARRHQAVIYLTNDLNPFGTNWKSKSPIEPFNKCRHWVQQLVMPMKYAVGRFAVILLNREDERVKLKEKQEDEPWYLLDPECFETEESEHSFRIRQAVTNNRAYATLPLQLGPDLTLEVKVFVMANLTRPLQHVTAIQTDDAKFVTAKSKITYKEKMPDIFGSGEEKEYEKKDLKMLVELGGKKIISTQDEYGELTKTGDKGIRMIGFKPLKEIDWTKRINTARYIRPSDDTILGSTTAFRALLEKCVERQMGMLCSFQTRSNEAVKLAILIPHINEEGEEHAKYRPSGFYAVTLPYKEDVRDLQEKVQEYGNFEPSESDKASTKAFIHKLKIKNYSPDIYSDPRIASVQSMIEDVAVGTQSIKVNDSIKPYHTDPMKLSRVKAALSDIRDHFSVGVEDGVSTSGTVTSKRGAHDDEFEESAQPKSKRSKKAGDDSLSKEKLIQMAEDNELSRLTVTQLREVLESMIEKRSDKPGGTVRKAQLTEALRVLLLEPSKFNKRIYTTST